MSKQQILSVLVPTLPQLPPSCRLGSYLLTMFNFDKDECNESEARYMSFTHACVHAKSTSQSMGWPCSMCMSHVFLMSDSATRHRPQLTPDECRLSHASADSLALELDLHKQIACWLLQGGCRRQPFSESCRVGTRHCVLTVLA